MNHTLDVETINPQTPSEALRLSAWTMYRQAVFWDNTATNYAGINPKFVIRAGGLRDGYRSSADEMVRMATYFESKAK